VRVVKLEVLVNNPLFAIQQPNIVTYLCSLLSLELVPQNYLKRRRRWKNTTHSITAVTAQYPASSCYRFKHHTHITGFNCLLASCMFHTRLSH